MQAPGETHLFPTHLHSGKCAVQLFKDVGFGALEQFFEEQNSDPIENQQGLFEVSFTAEQILDLISSLAPAT